MLSSDNGRTYLDHLFGMKLTDWRDLREQRIGRADINLEAAYPEKVDPELIDDNLRMLSAAVASDLFSDDEEGENKKEHLILIRTGKDTVYNDEAKEVLRAIYAILPPQLAFELGFASYQDLNAIPDLTKHLNIRIFVVPGNYDITGKTGQFYRVYDLLNGYGQKQQKQLYSDKKEDPLFRALWEMWKLPWNERQTLYSVLFPTDDARFHLRSHYLEQYGRFLSEKSKYKAWDGKTPAIGKAEDIPQIGDMFPILCAVPAYRESVLQKIKKAQKKQNGKPLDVKEFACEEYGKILARGKEVAFPEDLNKVTGLDDNTIKYACLTALKAAEVRGKDDDARRIDEVERLNALYNAVVLKHKIELEEQKALFVDRAHKYRFLSQKHYNELSEAVSEQIITYFDGTKYVGYTAGGEPNGKGIMIWSDGDIYKGDFVNGKSHGQGEMRWSDGRVYIGNWVNDSRTGEGTITFPNGVKYEGEFKDGEYDGTGKLTHADGTVEEGKFSNGKYIGSKNKNIIESDGANKTHNSEEKEFKAINDSTLPVEQNSFAQRNNTSGDDASASTHNSTEGGNTGSEENNKLKYNEGKYRRTIVPRNKTPQ